MMMMMVTMIMPTNIADTAYDSGNESDNGYHINCSKKLFFQFEYTSHDEHDKIFSDDLEQVSTS